jgi:hypothetical protein
VRLPAGNAKVWKFTSLYNHLGDLSVTYPSIGSGGVVQLERAGSSQPRWGSGRERLAVPKLLAAPGLALALWVMIGIAMLAFG